MANVIYFASAVTLFAVVAFTWNAAHDAHIEREAARQHREALALEGLEKLCGDAWPHREERYEQCLRGR